MIVGPSKHSTGGIAYCTYYVNDGGAHAIYVQHLGKPSLTYWATVDLFEYGQPVPPAGQVWLKTSGENEGVAEAFEAARILKRTGMKCDAGHSQAEHARLTDEACLAFGITRAPE